MKLNEFHEQSPNRSTMFPKLSRNQSLKKQTSPFAMPEDAQIFRMKEKQKDRKKQQKMQKQKMKIWEKGVKKNGITIQQLNQLGKQDTNEDQNHAKMSLIEAAKNAIKNRVKINQPMHDFISKKRETLLFQMLIDHKRQKINQFEEMTRLHRKGLERAEKMLEQDMQAFNAYLNQNKKQARDAIKNAEMQTRKKNEKVAVIKQKLQIQADLTGKNMSKRQTLQNLRKYKLFLSSLNPNISEEQRKQILDTIQKQQQQAQNFGGINVSQNLSDSSDQDDIYFKNPDQLMDVFHSLEQSNLSLITHLKQMQQEIQQSKSIFNSKKQILKKKQSQLLTNKQQVSKQISQVDQQIDDLKKTTNKDQVSVSYAQLESQIIKMAKQMQFIPANQKHLSALQLLKDIQLNIQKQLDDLKLYKDQNPLAIKQLQKTCFTNKRLRKQKQNQQQLQQKALKQKMEPQLEREKRKGRPIMARSVIKRQKKKKEIQVREPEQEIERRKYLLPD